MTDDQELPLEAEPVFPRERLHHWDPQPGDGALIRKHLERQAGLPPEWVRLDDGRVVNVGDDADGEEG